MVQLPFLHVNQLNAEAAAQLSSEESHADFFVPPSIAAMNQLLFSVDIAICTSSARVEVQLGKCPATERWPS
jgi:hypothetical protein